MIKADGDNRNMDTVTVRILPEVPVAEPTVEPTVEPTAVPTKVPTAEPTATATPTATPTPTPTPTPPGFEAVFAIAGLLAIAYLVLRKRRE